MSAGGIGTGKATLSNVVVSKLGARLIDCDKLQAKVIGPGEAAYYSVIKEAGAEVVDQNKKIDLKKLRLVRYELPESRKAINDLISMPLTKQVVSIVWDVFWRGTHTFAVVKYSFLLESRLLWWICYPIVHLDVSNEKTWVSRIKDKETCSPQSAKQLADLSRSADLLKDWAEIKIDNSDDKKKLASSFGEGFLPYITM